MKKQKIEHLDLWIKFQNCKTEVTKQKVRNQLILKYYKLVKKIGYSLSSKLNWKVSPDELTSYGLDGLYIAINKFDINKGVKFEQYASIRIQGSMIDAIRKYDIVPRGVRINNVIFEKTKAKLEAERGYAISNYEVAEELGIEDYNENVKNYHPIAFSSLEGSDMIVNNDDDSFKQDFNNNLVDKNTFIPDIKLKRKEFFSKLLGKDFSPIERAIVYFYYYKKYTMDIIAKKLNMSESRISQIHSDLLVRMKDKIIRNPNYFSQCLKNIKYDDSELLF